MRLTDDLQRGENSIRGDDVLWLIRRVDELELQNARDACYQCHIGSCTEHGQT